MTQPLLDDLVTLILVGVSLWLVNSYIPMESKVKKIVNILVVVMVGIWLLHTTGLWPSANTQASL